jgi:hypothetical protein
VRRKEDVAMRRTLAIAIGLFVLWSPGRSLADDCLPVIATCANDTAPIDPGDVVDDAVGTVTDTLGETEDTTDPIVDTVVDLVDDLLPGDSVIDPPGNDPSSHPGPPPDVRGREGEKDRGPSGTPSRPGGFVHEGVRGPTLIGTAASGTAPAATPSAPGRHEEFFRGAAQGLLLLGVLLGITIAFLAVQGRLDRNDTKLVSSPVHTEVVTFA